MSIGATDGGFSVVAERINAITQGRQFLIRPNCSMSWKGGLTVLGGISFVSLTIAIGFLMQGLWMVLPFAGLELLLLGGAFYHCALKLRQCEVISIEDGVVAVQRGRRAPEETVSFPCAQARVELRRARHRGYPTRLLIGAWSHRIEVGRCLNDDERGQLANRLREGMNLC